MVSTIGIKRERERDRFVPYHWYLEKREREREHQERERERASKQSKEERERGVSTSLSGRLQVGGDFSCEGCTGLTTLAGNLIVGEDLNQARFKLLFSFILERYCQ